MNGKGLLLAALFMGTALVVPMAASANPQVSVGVKIYDRDHKDYHVWDDHEVKFYDGYRHDHPEFKVDFRKNNREQQRAYWQWRHDHHD
jgi:hypothetical protein